MRRCWDSVMRSKHVLSTHLCYNTRFKNTNNFIQRMLKCMRVIFRLPKLLLKRLDEKDESETSPAKDTKKKLRPILSSLNMNPLEWIKMAITYISSNFNCTLFMKRSCCCYWESYILFRSICFLFSYNVYMYM